MSAQTMQAIEDAIVAHLKDVAEDPTDSGIVVDWGVAACLSKIDDDNDVVYRNVQVAPNNNPNGQASLHAWASAEIMEAMAWQSGDDDD